MSTFLDLCDAVKDYYGTGSDQWVTIATQGLNADNCADILSQVPGVSVTRSLSGRVTGYSLSQQLENVNLTGSEAIASAINSNVQTGTAAAGNTIQTYIPGSITNNGSVAGSSGATKYSGGSVAGTIASVVATVTKSIAAASVGTMAGKWILEEFYQADPDWWDEHVPYANPEKWAEIADAYDDNGIMKGICKLIYGVNNDNTMQAYMRDDQIQYMLYMLAQNGFFDQGADYRIPQITGTVTVSNLQSNGQAIGDCCIAFDGRYATTPQAVGRGSEDILFIQAKPTYNALKQNYYYPVIAVSRTLDAYFYFLDVAGGSSKAQSYKTNRAFTNNGNTFYANISRIPCYGHFTSGVLDCSTLDIGNTDASFTAFLNDLNSYNLDDYIGKAVSGAPTGVEDNPNATALPINASTAYNDIPTVLNNTYPDLYNNRIEIPYIDENGQSQIATYYPITLPQNGEGNQPITNLQPQAYTFISDNDEPLVTDTAILSIISPQPTGLTETTPDTLNPETNPPDTGSGNTPTVIIPTGSASRLWSVYNPTQAQVDDFGAWLWSNNFIDQIKKLFSDPMQAVIGIHKVFVTPSTDQNQGTIVCGYLDSQVPSKLVNNQYVTVNCGTVNLAEYFGNVLDYYDTEVYIYLPFIGIHQLDTSFIMRSNITVNYTVDVYTGATLAEIQITRDGFNSVIYTFSGDCSVRYPLSSGSYLGIVSGILSATATLASGNIIGGALSLGNAKTQVQKSGSLQGNTGAMGCKKPYLIISRPQTAYTDFEHYQGYGSNQRVSISSLSGYAKLSDVDVQGVSGATGEELQMIRTILETGIHITG